MHLHRETIGFFTVLAIACCLVLGVFASPVEAKTIVVTTFIDTAIPPFDADGVCGTGTVSDLPTNGPVSLREAIIAANNTPGEHTITFAPSLRGEIIVVNFDDLDADLTPDALPALCRGHTRIEGHLDANGVPDITLDGDKLPVAAPAVAAAGILVLSSHNTINGLSVQHFPIGIQVRAGEFTTPGTVTHTTVTNNLVTESKIDGINVRTGNVPDSQVAHTTLSQNKVTNNTRFGIIVVANLSGVGSYTQIAHTTITDNEVTENGNSGILMVSLGNGNLISKAAITHNMVSSNSGIGIEVRGGYAGAKDNTLDVRIRGNRVADNENRGIFMIAGQDSSSNNHIAARIEENTLERNQIFGIEAVAGNGAADFRTGISVNNELGVRIKRNTVESQTGVGILVAGGVGSSDGRDGAIANNNQTDAEVTQNTVEDSTGTGILLVAGAKRASANTLEVWVAHNAVCDNHPDIVGVSSPMPNPGTGNVLEGQIFQNTATTVTVADGTSGNTAAVTQFKNDPCS